MKVAVTNHAVDRYLERAEGAKGFDRESVRQIIRGLVSDGFAEGVVRDHPTEPDRRIIPFKSGNSVLYLSIGKNTTSYPADFAVIGVLFEREVTLGRVGMGMTLGDVHPHLRRLAACTNHPRYAVFIGPNDTIEHYRFKEREEVEDLLQRRGVPAEQVAVYMLSEKW